MTTPHHNDEEDDYDLYLEECIYCQHPAAHCRCDAIYDQSTPIYDQLIQEKEMTR